MPKSNFDPKTSYDKEFQALMVELELERLRSQRFIQATYCTFALLAVATAVLFYTFYNALGIPAHEGQLIGQCFLVLAAGNLVVLSIWEFVWRR